MTGSWRRLLRPGDWGVAGAGLLAVALAFILGWRGGVAERAVVRRDGAVVAELPLTMNKRIEVTGPLGVTVVEIAPGRARVASDPGPRQYCVRQGWLTQPNAIAICAPNHVTLTLNGGPSTHDSVSY